MTPPSSRRGSRATIRLVDRMAEVKIGDTARRFDITDPADPAARTAILGWLSESTVEIFQVRVTGRWARCLVPSLRSAGYRVTVARMPSEASATVSCQVDRYSVSVDGSADASDPEATFDLDQSGRTNLRQLLAAAAPLSEIRILDPYGTGRELAADLALDSVPTHLVPVPARWYVSVEADGHDFDLWVNSEAVVDFGLRSSAPRPPLMWIFRTFEDSESGRNELLTWMGAIGEVLRVTVADRDGRGDVLAGLLNDRDFRVARERSTRGPLPDQPWGARFGRFRCRLELRGDGWLRCCLEVGDRSIILLGSWLGSPWIDTLDALRAMVEGAPSARFAWIQEPGSVRVWLTRLDKQTMRLELRDDGRLFGDFTDPPVGEPFYASDVDIRAFAEAFRAASHAILDATDKEDVDARWAPRLQPTTALPALDLALDGPEDLAP